MTWTCMRPSCAHVNTNDTEVNCENCRANKNILKAIASFGMTDKVKENNA